MTERFTEVEGNTLKIYYNLSTFNPYTVVKMRSEFTISRSGISAAMTTLRRINKGQAKIERQSRSGVV